MENTRSAQESRGARETGRGPAGNEIQGDPSQRVHFISCWLFAFAVAAGAGDRLALRDGPETLGTEHHKGWGGGRGARLRCGESLSAHCSGKAMSNTWRRERERPLLIPPVHMKQAKVDL